MLIDEGNICKAQWWEEQIQKIEDEARNNKRFWNRIKILSGKHTKNNKSQKKNKWS